MRGRHSVPPVPNAAVALVALAGLAALPTAPPARAATTPFADCEAAVAADPDGWKTCACFHRVAVAEGLQDEAIERLEEHRAGDPDDPCLAWTLGRLLIEHREVDEAAILLRRAADEYAARGLTDGEVYARLNRSDALATAGAGGDEVADELDRAREAAEASGDPVLEAEVAVQEARTLLLRGGALDLVEASLRRVHREAFPTAHPNLRRGILFNLGTVLYRRGRFAEAEEVFAEMVEVTSGAGLRYAEAAARLSRASAAGARLPAPGRRERVIGLLEEAVAAAHEAGHPFAEIEARKRLGRLLGGAEGREHLRTALALAERYRDRAPTILAGVLSASAMDLLEDDPAEARRRVDEASTLLLETDDPWHQAYGWADRLRVLWATAPRQEALAAARSTLEIADRLAEVQETEGGRAEVFSVWTEVYQWLAGRLLADAEEGEGPETLATAFAVAERMRARLLLESLAAAGVELRGTAATVDPELEASWREVERRIVGVHRRLLDPRTTEEHRRELLVELDGLEREEARLAARRHRLRKDGSPESIEADALLTPESFVGLDALQAELAPNQALLAFQMGPWKALDGSFAGGAWVVTVTRNRVGLHRLPGRAEIEPAVDVFLHLFERRDGSEGVPAATLYDGLLREALASLPPEVERLILVPDGPLHRLPFAALREAPGAPPVAARHELTVAPSATVWKRLGTLEERGTITLAVADPPPPGGASAPRVDPTGTERSWTAGVRLAALPHARREGRKVVRSLGEPGRLLVGAEATERAVKEGAGRGLRVLHFGTHAVLDEAYPHRSAVVLAPGGPDEDGLLRPREAAALGLDGALVVLSACQSASGTVLQGEGALSLARAFLRGGARAVIGSLWPVEDAEAADLLGRFYHHLGQGDSVARALTRAQREAFASGAPAAAWAGWTVLGDGGAVVRPQASRPHCPASGARTVWFSAGGLIALLLVLTVGGGFVVYAKRSHQG